jgi:hypothetical protein
MQRVTHSTTVLPEPDNQQATASGRLGGSSAKFIGSVYAADENQALAAAIKLSFFRRRRCCRI